MPSFRRVILFFVVAAVGAGCVGPGPVEEFKFDARGWGGAGLEYTFDPVADSIAVRSGMLVREGFRWAESEFAFEFLDARDLVWGFRLMDSEFAEARRAALRDQRFTIGGKEFTPGRDLPADQLWKFDVVVEAVVVAEPKGRAYKVLDAEWCGRLPEDGRTGVGLSARLDLQVRRGAWNTFRARVRKGEMTCWVNGREGSGTLQVDPRANGRLGLFVATGGPLRIRKLRLGDSPLR